MLTIVETPVFQRTVQGIWSEDELDAFKVAVANDPMAGDVISGAGGLRKVRWSRAGMGKRGGARVIYWHRPAEGVVALLLIYVKAKFDNLPTGFLARLKKELEDAEGKA